MGRARRIEELEQAALMDWARYVKTELGFLSDYLFAIPNGAMLGGDLRLRSLQAKRLKRTGMMPGASDLFLAIPRRQWHGFYIEMKKPMKYFGSMGEARRAISKDQAEFGKRMLAAGYLWMVFFGGDQARAGIELYLAGKQVVAAGVPGHGV